MKHIAIAITGSGLLELHGEPMFDSSENTFIVSGDNGTYVQFNWNNIDFFSVQEGCPHENEDHDD